MATFLDISGLGFFSSIFTFLLVFVAVYSLLTWAKILGTNAGLHALMAVSIAVLFMFSKDAIQMVNYVVPWFSIMFIVLLLIMMAYAMFNPSAVGDGLFKALGSYHKMVVYWIIGLSVVIILLGLGNTYGQSVGPYLNSDGTVTNPDGTISQANDTNVVSGTADNFRGTGGVASGDYKQNLGATIFHPKMLGVLFILFLGTFTILMMTGA